MLVQAVNDQLSKKLQIVIGFLAHFHNAAKIEAHWGLKTCNADRVSLAYGHSK